MIKNIYNSLPESLTERKIWATWKLEGSKKPPYQTDGNPARTNDKSTWASFEEANQAYEAGGFDGVGLFLDNLTCIDLDKVRNAVTGELKPFAEEIVQEVKGWTEVSTSGSGVHILATCNAELEGCSKAHDTCKVEIFRHSRFIALTGHRIENGVNEIPERTEQIKRVHVQYIAAAPSSKIEPLPSFDINIDERLSIAYNAKNGAEIKALMEGDTSAHDGDDSSADLALCCHLAFYFNKDAVLIEQVFGQSALALRDKWKQRADYRKRTINEAIKMTTSAFQPSSMTATDGMPLLSDIISVIARQRVESFPPCEDKYLVEPEVPEGFLVLVTGKPSSGKSTLVLDWCFQVAQAGRRVLYLDRDNPLSVVQSRIRRFGGTPTSMTYWGRWNKDDLGTTVDPPDFGSDILLDFARQHKPLIVFDTFSKFFDGSDENSNTDVAVALKDASRLTSAGATVIIIHHTAKSDTSTSRGGSALEANVDIAMKVESERNEQGYLVCATVAFFKSRLLSADQTYTFDDAGRPMRAGLKKELTSDDLVEVLKAMTVPIKKQDFEARALAAGFRRQMVREFMKSEVFKAQHQSSRAAGDGSDLIDAFADEKILSHEVPNLRTILGSESPRSLGR